MPAFSVLLVGMLVELMLAPILNMVAGGFDVARVTTAIVLLAALSVVGVGRTALVLFVPTSIALALASFSTDPVIVILSMTLRAAFLCYVMAVVVWHVSTSGNVTGDTVAGAACAYMLLGFVWAAFYQMVEYLRPASFDIPSAFFPGASRNPQMVLTYFSFGTLTTLGYGDVKPGNAAVGGLCVAEALVGQLYLAVMIARMVGLYTARRTS